MDDETRDDEILEHETTEQPEEMTEEGHSDYQPVNRFPDFVKILSHIFLLL